MKEGPDISRVAALIGEPARANMLSALMTGRALTATELALEAGVALQTASAHLARLEQGGLLRQRKHGRRKYFTLAHDDVARVLEALMGLAAEAGHLRSHVGPRDPELRRARVCYNHLAGEMGLRMFDSMVERRMLTVDDDHVELTEAGAAHVARLGVDLAQLRKGRPALCRPCLDWSGRRPHLAGSLGRALFSRFEALDWLRRAPGSRAVTFTAKGEAAFKSAFPLDADRGDA